ncbi:CobW family GTP-binding protein [Mesorhizobium huakuii]|uniref:GTP-binding protein n=1 Tax=Mesorhizobium huakuii TaxID=28104 RepID=A0A7G6T499_9HYPH|nr:GTP-binding protein [Mesorhizobium huakuii]QND61581.1 GTP-binding protein [Mesorhizobium huakuii]
MDKIPVFVLTGFLGAGKSTLLDRLLADPAFCDTAVIINEFGDVALDHDLVRVGETQVARTTTGCLCCTIGSDIRSTLHELHVLAGAGEISFDRVIVETTGLADPAPLVNQLMPGGSPAFGLRDHLVARNFVVERNFELAGVVTLFDIVTGELSIENHFEAAKQIAFADRIVLTKSDLASDPASLRDIESLRARLAALNPAAPIDNSHQSGFDPAELFQRRVYAPASLGDDVIGWLALEEAIRGDGGHGSNGTAKPGASPFARRGGRIRTFAITRESPIGRDAFQTFLGLLSMSARPRLLRVKGLLHDRDEPQRPRVIHAVQHVVYPPAILDGWPSADRHTRLVFITDGIDPEPVRQLFEAALDGKPIKAGRALRQLASAVAETFRSGATQLARALTG